MKKLLSLILAGALLVGAMFALTSCSLFGPKPELDLETAAENLEDAKYAVNYVEADDDEFTGGI